MKRREFIALLGGATAWPLAARAQQLSGNRKIGVLHPGESTVVNMRIGAIRDGLNGPDQQRDSGVELVIRLADGDLSRLPALAKDLVNHRVESIVAAGPAAVKAAVDATTSIPVIAIDLESDPVASGFVMSLAQPGRNISGVFLDFPDFSAKCHHTAVAARSRRRGDRITPLMHPHCCTRSSLLLAHSDASRQRSTSVAFGTKRTY